MIKWHRVETSYEAVLSFCTNVQAYHNRAGMWPWQMRYVLKTLRMKFKVKCKFDLAYLESLLKSGGSAILVYETDRGGHCVFVDAVNEHGFRTWNRRKDTGAFMSREDMKRAISAPVKMGVGVYLYCFQALRTA